MMPLDPCLGFQAETGKLATYRFGETVGAIHRGGFVPKPPKHRSLG